MLASGGKFEGNNQHRTKLGNKFLAVNDGQWPSEKSHQLPNTTNARDNSDKRYREFADMATTETRSADDNANEKTELLKRSADGSGNGGGGGGVYEKKTGKMLEARYRATDVKPDKK